MFLKRYIGRNIQTIFFDDEGDFVIDGILKKVYKNFLEIEDDNGSYFVNIKKIAYLEFDNNNTQELEIKIKKVEQ